MKKAFLIIIYLISGQCHAQKIWQTPASQEWRDSLEAWGNLRWQTIGGGGGVAWGGITGSLPSQLDLQSALDAKQDLITTGSPDQYFDGTLSLQIFPTLLSQFTNDPGYITGITSGDVTTALGFNPVPDSRSLRINGVSFDLTTDQTWTVGDLISANDLSDITSAPTALTNLGGTTVGKNFFTLTDPSAITFPRINADNTVSALDASTFRSAIGAGTGSGTVTNFSAGDLSPLFTTSEATTTTTPALTFTLSNATAFTVFGRATGTGSPSFLSIDTTFIANFHSKVHGLFSATSPMAISSDGVISIQNAAADGSTKGASSFTANDFNASSGNISIDYSNWSGLVKTNNLSELSSAPTARTNLGASTLGSNMFTVSNPSADGYLRVNSSNTVTHRTYSGVKIDLSLDNVENTALSTWAGSSNITTLGNITTGSWAATDIPYSRIAQASGLSVLGVTGTSTADVASITGTANQVLFVNSAGTSLAFGSLAQAQLPTGLMVLISNNETDTSGTTAASKARNTAASLGGYTKACLEAEVTLVGVANTICEVQFKLEANDGSTTLETIDLRSDQTGTGDLWKLSGTLKYCGALNASPYSIETVITAGTATYTIKSFRIYGVY